MSNKRTILLDASAMKKHDCEYHMWLSTLEGYRKPLHYNDLEFGSAFHAFRSIFRSDPSKIIESIQAAQDYYSRPMLIKSKKESLTPDLLRMVCTGYMARYRTDNIQPVLVNGEAMVEKKFALPYYQDDEVEVLLCGTMDEIGIKNGKRHVYIDCKVTGTWNPKAFLEGFNLSSQMLFYRWMIKQYGIWKPDSILAKIDTDDLACIIDGVFITSTGTVFKRSEEIWYSKDQINEVDELIRAEVDNVVRLAKSTPARTGMLNGACNRIVQCEFFKHCDAPDKLSRDMILENEYVKQQYNPMEHGK